MKDDPCDDWSAVFVPRLVTIKEIQHVVAREFSIPVMEMQSERRDREVSRPRQVAMLLSYELTRASLPAIGKRFGGRDHTTVMHAIHNIRRLTGEDAELAGAVTRARLRLVAA